jgi:hypothetical protein
MSWSAGGEGEAEDEGEGTGERGRLSRTCLALLIGCNYSHCAVYWIATGGLGPSFCGIGVTSLHSGRFAYGTNSSAFDSSAMARKPRRPSELTLRADYRITKNEPANQNPNRNAVQRILRRNCSYSAGQRLHAERGTFQQSHGLFGADHRPQLLEEGGGAGVGKGFSKHASVAQFYETQNSSIERGACLAS